MAFGFTLIYSLHLSVLFFGVLYVQRARAYRALEGQLSPANSHFFGDLLILVIFVHGKTSINPVDFYFPTTQSEDMTHKKHFTAEEAKKIGEKLRIDWSKFDVEQFRMGMDVELEHGLQDPNTNVTNDDPLMTGKIALAHLNEFPDYYTRLKKMEKEAEQFHEKKMASE